MKVKASLKLVRRLARRLIVATVLIVQSIMILAAYGSDHSVFGFQMFPESSRWKAEIVRVEADGTTIPINDAWEYRWSDLVRGRGLGNPFVWHHADAGLQSQLAFFQASLNWVSQHTPNDTSTLYLQANVTYRDNGRAPVLRVFRSPDREIEDLQ